MSTPVIPHVPHARINGLIAFFDFELFVWDANYIVRVLAAPAGRGNGLKRAIRKGASTGIHANPLIAALDSARWFPIGLEGTVTLALDDLADRLDALPTPYDQHPDIRGTWKDSVLTVCDLAELASNQQKNDSALPSLIMKMMNAKGPLPTNYNNLIQQLGY